MSSRLSSSPGVLITGLAVLELFFAGLAFLPSSASGQGCPNTGKQCVTNLCPRPCQITSACQTGQSGMFHCSDGFNCSYGSWRISIQGNGSWCLDSQNQQSTCNANQPAANCLTYNYYTDANCITPAKCGSSSCNGSAIVVTTTQSTCMPVP